MLNNKFNVLDEILHDVEGGRRASGIWFNYQYLKNKKKKHVMRFVPCEVKGKRKFSNQMLQHPAKF